jgi:ribonucleoside-diphosphate reductase beta chain
VFRQLFQDLVDENPDVWTEEFREDLRSTMAEAVRLEKAFISDCLPVSAVGLTLQEFTSYIDFIGDRRLKGVGLAPLNPPIENPLPWLSEQMEIRKETNFFEGRVTEYQKAGALAAASDDDL